MPGGIMLNRSSPPSRRKYCRCVGGGGEGREEVSQTGEGIQADGQGCQPQTRIFLDAAGKRLRFDYGRLPGLEAGSTNTLQSLGGVAGAGSGRACGRSIDKAGQASAMGGI